MPLPGMRRPPVAEFTPDTDAIYNLILQYMKQAGSIRKYTPLPRTVSDEIE